ncbi:11445_t:CDS:1, partial [Acaulospora morrowiae]
VGPLVISQSERRLERIYRDYRRTDFKMLFISLFLRPKMEYSIKLNIIKERRIKSLYA